MLTETAVRAARVTQKPAKLFDGGGLYLLVNPQGSRLWRLKYRIYGKEKLLAIGAYPDLSLKRAREKRDEARRLLADGIDPSAQRKAEKLAHAETFETIAAEWLDLQRKRFTAASIKKAEWMFDDLLNPFIGSKPITTSQRQRYWRCCARSRRAARMRPHIDFDSVAAKSFATQWPPGVRCEIPPLICVVRSPRSSSPIVLQSLNRDESASCCEQSTTTRGSRRLRPR